LACIWQWISGDPGVGLSVLGEFPGSGGMGRDILSKRDLLPAVGAMGLWRGDGCGDEGEQGFHTG